ncbi:hypothetical protein D6C83_09527 [Aureobasidium pullulans]|uniref:Uncharacterized protein n=1 Tax=Aureobasidium pullulans TaxID=5580 RepID=A0A4V4L0C2_AURPU|nr:hypothetical protein D6C83_09527 [Aureobasidium pullulans]
MTAHFLRTRTSGNGTTTWCELLIRPQKQSVTRTTLARPCRKLVSQTSQNGSSRHHTEHGQLILRLSILATSTKPPWTSVLVWKH